LEGGLASVVTASGTAAISNSIIGFIEKQVTILWLLVSLYGGTYNLLAVNLA